MRFQHPMRIPVVVAAGGAGRRVHPRDHGGGRPGNNGAYWRPVGRLVPQQHDHEQDAVLGGRGRKQHGGWRDPDDRQWGEDLDSPAPSLEPGVREGDLHIRLVLLGNRERELGASDLRHYQRREALDGSDCPERARRCDQG